jgi:hypothetical protein
MRRCEKGKPCGATCIERRKICRAEVMDSLQKDVRKTSEEISNRNSNLPKLETALDFKKLTIPVKTQRTEKLSKLYHSLPDDSPLKKKVGEKLLKVLDSPDANKVDSKLAKAELDFARIFGYKSSDMSQPERDNADRLLKSLTDKLGEQGIKDGLRAIRDFSGGQYKSIRKAQRSSKIAEIFPDSYKKGNDLERLINQSGLPRPSVIKYRGITATDEMLDHLLKASKTNGGYSENATSSWSTDLKWAAKFSNRGINEGWGNHRVIFRTINSRGVPIRHLSSVEDESELLTTRDAKYLHRKYRLIDVDGVKYHIFDVEELP